MLLLTIINTALYLAPLAFAIPIVPEQRNTAQLGKRKTWSAYLYSGARCNNAQFQTGYSLDGSTGCITVQANSLNADPEGCTITTYADPNCDPASAFDAIWSSDTCAGPEFAIAGLSALQGFTVSC